MTVHDMWLRHIDSLGEGERHGEIQRFNELCRESEEPFSGVIAEYLMFLHDGTVAPMPDMSVWMW